MSEKDTSPPRDALERLERELEAERQASAELRAGVHNLQRTVSELRNEFSAQIRDSEAKAQRAQAELRRQGGAGNGVDASSSEVQRIRDELARVASERDALQQRLVRIEGMQTETIALPDEPTPASSEFDDAPSIDELMASLNEMMEDTSHARRQPAFEETSADADWQEMLPPELIAPEEYKDEDDNPAPRPGMAGARLLVLLDSERPIKYPLYKQIMTIGRAESADIQIDGNFISRIHARVICRDNGVEIEDAGSKNGVKVNAKRVERRALAHGDVLGIGSLKFTYLETPDG
jgi:hypothetical protein